jgi:16S rRNA G966 N2-methylase RsmD
LRALRANITHIGVEHRISLLAKSAHRALAELEPADLWLLDPPYALDELDSVVAALFAKTMVRGQCVLETAKRRAVPPPPLAFLREERVYGDTKLMFFIPAPA